MLPKQERLKKTGLFKKAYSIKKSVSTPLLTLYVLPRQKQSPPRLPYTGFVVSKKVHNKATERNRIKRRVREAYKRLKERLIREQKSEETAGQECTLKKWYAIVWIINSDALKASWQDICTSVEECLEKAKRKYGTQASR